MITDKNSDLIKAKQKEIISEPSIKAITELRQKVSISFSIPLQKIKLLFKKIFR